MGDRSVSRSKGSPVKGARLALAVLLALTLGLVGPTPLAAEEPASEKAADQLAAALRLRVEAQMKRAEILSRLGRDREALEVLEAIDGLYEKGLVEIRRLLAGRARALPTRPAVADVPPPAPTPPRIRDVMKPSPLVRPGTWPLAKARRAVEEAIDRGLTWLAAHQSKDGAFHPDEFATWFEGRRIDPPASAAYSRGKATHVAGTTGLATLSFLWAGHTPGDRTALDRASAKGLAWLIANQDEEGCIGSRATPAFIYGHAFGTLALVEAYGITEHPSYKKAAQKALAFSSLSRNPYFGWRYGVKPGDNDTSVTHWMLFGLKAAQAINEAHAQAGRAPAFAIDKAAFSGALTWVDKMTDADYGRVGYISRGSGAARPKELIDTFPNERSESMTAAGINIRFMAGQSPDQVLIQKGAKLLARNLPRWDVEQGTLDMYYWHVGTLAAYQVGGLLWKDWSKALLTATLPTQRRGGSVADRDGSWDPAGPWGQDGGRVYSTALVVQMLSAWLRAHSER